MRSTPGRPYPLIIPLSAGQGKHSFAKIVFSDKVLTTFPQKMVFSAAPRGQAAHATVWALGGQGDTKNQLKNDMEKGCSKRRLQSALWGAMGSLGEPPGDQMEPKWEPKGSQKISKNFVFSGPDGKPRNVRKTYYLLHFSHIGHTIRSQFLVILRVQK